MFDTSFLLPSLLIQTITVYHLRSKHYNSSRIFQCIICSHWKKSGYASIFFFCILGVPFFSKCIISENNCGDKFIATFC